MLIYSKLLILKYALYNETYPLLSLGYDLTMIAIIFLIIELLRTRYKAYLYLLVNLVLSFSFFSIVVYFKYFETIPSYFDLAQLDQVSSVRSSILKLISKKDYIFFIDIIPLILLLFYMKKAKRISNPFSKKSTLIAMTSLILIGGFNFFIHKDKPILNMTLFVRDHGFVNTQFVQMYANTSMAKQKQLTAYLGEDRHISPESIERVKGNEFVSYELQEAYGLAEGRNLIVLQIESLQNIMINLEIDGQEVTPNLNQLLEESYYFSNVYQQIGAGNTSDAEFLMNTSIYPIGNRPTSNFLPDHDFMTLPKLLKEEGYYTATFHADEIEYWNRKELYPFLGFDDYYDLDFFGEEDIIGLGPSDQVLYDKSFGELLKLNEEYDQYYLMINSMTSHSPFEMPEDKQWLDLPEEYEDTLVGNYLQSVHYADATLGDFFDRLKEEGLWEQSMIVVYGDHSGLHGTLMTEKDNELMADLTGNYSLLKRFNSPFIVSIPGILKEEERIEVTGGHIDMMPTITNLLGLHPPSIMFGHNLLEYEHNLIGMRYYLPTGSFINDDLMYLTENLDNDVRIYSLEDNKAITDDFDKPKREFKAEIEKMLQLYHWSDYYFFEGETEF